MIQTQSISSPTCESTASAAWASTADIIRYHDHGDTIAVQYGGSHLVNTMETYRKINQWTSHSRDMVESFKRYYNNSFLDAQRQEAYNLFLGNYIFAQGQPMLWDLSTDYYLHHSDPRMWSAKSRKSYIDWYTLSYLTRRKLPGLADLDGSASKTSLELLDDYWLEYYRPLALSSFTKIFSYRMNSTLRYVPFQSTQERKYDLSPFHVRSRNEPDTPEKSRLKQVSNSIDPGDGGHSLSTPTMGVALPSWRHAGHDKALTTNHNMQSGPQVVSQEIPVSLAKVISGPKDPKDKSAIAQWTLNQFVLDSLNPTVTKSETDEYSRYISHPLNLPLVISGDITTTPNPEFVKYLGSVSEDILSNFHVTEEDIAEYAEFLDVGEDPLTVTDADGPKKRYKAYKQWLLKGKSLFKQSRVDP